MIKASNHLKKVDDKTIIWRYMDFVSLYHLITTGKIYFRRLDKYSDKLEGTLCEKTQKELYHHRHSFLSTSKDEAEIWAKNEILNIENFKAWTLSNSWIMNETDSFAMWKIYCPQNGIAIKSTVEKLKRSLEENKHEIYIGAVNYEIVKYPDLNQFTVSTNKRKYYSFENEIRALMINQFNVEKDGAKNRWIPQYYDGLEVPIDLSLLIDSIYVSPFTGKWFLDCVKKLVKEKLNILSLDNIVQSEIEDK
jgi:hypothetical protein